LTIGQSVEGQGCETKLNSVCPSWKSDVQADCLACVEAHLSDLAPECTETLARKKCSLNPAPGPSPAPGGDTTLKKILLPEDKFGASGGRCLDGSMSGYYYGEPSSGNSSTWVFFMQGGGACNTEADCSKRAEGKLGSSNPWAATDDSSDAGPILLADASVNPDFHDAHHVWVPYCTGDSHAGQVVEPTDKQWGFYFSGHLNFKSILSHISATIPAASQMERALLTGASAGGKGTMVNCDFMQSFMSEAGSSARVSCAPIGGWFVPGFTEDHPNDPDAQPSTWADWSAGKATPVTHNEDNRLLYVPPACVDARGDESWRCATMHVLYPYIKAPMYVIESMYDKYQVNSVYGLPSSEASSLRGQEYIAYFGRAMRNSTNLVVNHPLQKSGDGLFLPSCWAHTGGLKYPGRTELSGFTTLQAVGDWFFGRGGIPNILVDDCNMPAPGLPCNPTCANVPTVLV